MGPKLNVFTSVIARVAKFPLPNCISASPALAIAMSVTSTLLSGISSGISPWYRQLVGGDDSSGTSSNSTVCTSGATPATAIISVSPSSVHGTLIAI